MRNRPNSRNRFQRRQRSNDDRNFRNINVNDDMNIGEKIAGITHGNVSNASSNYNSDKFRTPRGHGFAAENANHLYDLYHGKNAKIVGDNNAKNGADRLVDGVYIQTKYCKTGSKCVAECFENGKMRYLNADGTPMQIEVPSDKYDDAIRAMQERIRRGEVPGTNNPEDAKKIIKKGAFTYEQAKNIAKAGTIESITYDAANGAIIAVTSMGISAVITFATSCWNGDDLEIAAQKAARVGLSVGGTTFATSILAGQMSKTALNSMLVGSSEAVISALGPKASAYLVNAFRSGTNIYGAAAMKSAAKMLRGNVITGIASIVVLSCGDIADIFQGRISGTQLFKNVSKTTSSVVGGIGGWTAGASLGATIGSVVPGVGTAIGGFVGGIAGSLLGGSAANTVSSVVLDKFVEDDANEMIEIIEREFKVLAEEFLVNKTEAESIADKLKENLTGETLKDMYAAENRRKFAREILEPYFVEVVKDREFIYLPSAKEMTAGLKSVLEQLDDEDCHH